MLKAVQINGRPTGAPDEDTDRVSLELCTPYATHHCTACGEELTEDVDGYQAVHTGALACPDAAPQSGPDQASRPHQPQPIPLSWCNHATIAAHEDDDSVTVIISVGDPRGGFCFTVRRVPDQAPEHPGRLVLHTPYPGEPMPHATLTQIREGAYLIGD